MIVWINIHSANNVNIWFGDICIWWKRFDIWFCQIRSYISSGHFHWKRVHHSKLIFTFVNYFVQCDGKHMFLIKAINQAFITEFEYERRLNFLRKCPILKARGKIFTTCASTMIKFSHFSFSLFRLKIEPHNLKHGQNVLQKSFATFPWNNFHKTTAFYQLKIKEMHTAGNATWIYHIYMNDESVDTNW